MPHIIMATIKLVVKLNQIILQHKCLYFHHQGFMLAKSIGSNSKDLDFVACLSSRLSPVASNSNPFL